MIIAPLAMLVIVRPLLEEFPASGAGEGVRRTLARSCPPDPLPRRPHCASRLDPAGGRLHRRRRLLELPGPARRAGRAAGTRRRAEGVPADRPRPAGPLRGPGPLRRLRAARRRHPRAAGRVPRRRRLAQPGEAVRHRRRLQPDRLRLLLARDARPLPLRDHQPRRLEQPGAAELQAGRQHPLLRALETDRADAGGPPRPARGDRGGRLRRLRRAGDPHPPRQPRPRLALPRRRDRPERRLGRRQHPRHRRRDLAVAATCRRAAGTSRCSTSPPSTSPSRRRASAKRCRRRSTASGRTRSASATTASSGPPAASRARAARSASPSRPPTPSTLQSLSGYDGKAYVGELVAVPAEPHRTVPLAQACDRWIDWYEAAEAP